MKEQTHGRSRINKKQKHLTGKNQGNKKQRAQKML